MGDVRVCYTTPEVDRGNNGSTLLYINYQVELQYDFDYGDGCYGEGKTVRLPVYHYAYNYERFYSSAMASVMRGWMTYTRDIEDVLTGRHLSDACWESYRERFDEKRGELSEYVRRGLEERTEIARNSQRTLALAQAIQSWMSVAFDRVRVRLGVVDDTVAGRVGLPDVAGMLQDNELYPWEIADRAEREINQLDDALRSRGMRDAVEYGFGHRLLTDAEFAVLDDFEGGRARAPATVGEAR